MNTLLKVKKNILTKSFNNKVSSLVNNAIKNKSNDLLIHNDGKVCREDSQWVTFKHDFAPGIYLRQMTMSKDSVVLGAVHKRDHAWFLLKGYVTVVSEDGDQDYEAPYLGFSKAGTQRVIYAHEESIFQNVFKNPNNIKDIDLLEEYNCCINKEKYTEYVNNK
jgi:hypothetical protein